MRGANPNSWMVYFMENPFKWMITRGTPMTKRKPPYVPYLG